MLVFSGDFYTVIDALVPLAEGHSLAAVFWLGGLEPLLLGTLAMIFAANPFPPTWGSWP